MNPNEAKRAVRWYVRDRWGLIPAVTGALIVAFVIITRGTQATWLLWLAIPLLIFGLGYFFVVNALRYFS